MDGYLYAAQGAREISLKWHDDLEAVVCESKLQPQSGSQHEANACDGMAETQMTHRTHQKTAFRQRKESQGQTDVLFGRRRRFRCARGLANEHKRVKRWSPSARSRGELRIILRLGGDPKMRFFEDGFRLHRRLIRTEGLLSHGLGAFRLGHLPLRQVFGLQDWRPTLQHFGLSSLEFFQLGNGVLGLQRLEGSTGTAGTGLFGEEPCVPSRPVWGPLLLQVVRPTRLSLRPRNSAVGWVLA